MGDAEAENEEKKLAFEIIGEKAATLNKEQIYEYLCALGESCGCCHHFQHFF